MSLFPLTFYLVCAALIVFGWRAIRYRREAWGLPALAVLVTVTVWYVVDALYNDYAEYLVTVGPEPMDQAWWQVLLFVVGFGLLVEPLHRWINRRLLKRSSYVMRVYDSHELNRGSIQRQLGRATLALAAVWAGLMGVGILRVEGDVVGLFAPYLTGAKADPWGRGRLGGGIDALLSFASYFQIFLTAAFGVIFALSRDPKIRTLAGIICLLSMPYFIFDRTRNTMLATVIPGVLAWVFLRVKANLLVKGMLVLGAFLAVNFWFTFVMANRADQSIAAAFSSKSRQSAAGTKHLGLNMLEELGWIGSFIDSGAYQVNWGQRYFAEIVNPIPRVLWKNKPLIGMDYAIARGQKDVGGDNLVTASISTGMIGQGVVNFGRILGPLTVAILMSLWVALLARQDLLGWKQPERLMIYATGLILTFNMGRDVTLLVLYPFVFGLGLVWVWHRIQKPGAGDQAGPERVAPGRSRRKSRRSRPAPLSPAPPPWK